MDRSTDQRPNAPRRWTLLAREVDTAILHAPRWDSEGVELADLAGLPWELCANGRGRRAVVADGLAVEVDTQFAGNAARVTMGPGWIWRQGGLALAAASRLLSLDLAAAEVYRVDVAADFAAPSLARANAVILDAHARALRSPLPGQPACTGRPHGQKGLTARIGIRGGAIQRRVYLKTAPEFWAVLHRYSPRWGEAGWPGYRCPYDHAGAPGERCGTCGRPVDPWPVVRLEVEWPHKYLAGITPAEVEASAVGWISDGKSKGRRALLDERIPPVLRSRLTEGGTPRPSQRPRESTAIGAVVHWHRRAEAAARRAEEVADASPEAARVLTRLRSRRDT